MKDWEAAERFTGQIEADELVCTVLQTLTLPHIK